ncbi:MAG: hypothetical protein ABSG71_18330 [Thermodesulfobacteriota bacterium]|jgi:hypothetical protein
MKAKEHGLTKSDGYKQAIIKELEFVLLKMTQSNNIEDKIYYFSAIQGMLHRVMNLEYTDDLLFAHFITNEVHKSFIQRIMSLKQGETVVRLTEQQSVRLVEITKEFLEAIKNDDNLDSVLRQYVALLYSTTGNGYYLMEKGVLKI